MSLDIVGRRGFPRVQLIRKWNWSKHIISALLLHLEKLLNELNGLLSFCVENLAHHLGLDRLLESWETRQTFIDCILHYSA